MCTSSRCPREDSLAKTLARTHSEYTLSVNRTRKRTGHLWQNRFYSCPMGPTHLQRAMLYVDMNPVRAGSGNGAVGLDVVERADSHSAIGQRSRHGRAVAGILRLLGPYWLARIPRVRNPHGRLRSSPPCHTNRGTAGRRRLRGAARTGIGTESARPGPGAAKAKMRLTPFLRATAA